MPRAKEFDTTEALMAALATFMEKGYAATNVEDLVAATGVNRSSLYNEFGDKRGLYLKALQFYCDNGMAEVRAILSLKQPARMVLANFRDFLKGKISDPIACKGCLAVSTVMGAANADPEAHAIVDAMFKRKQALLEEVIARGQKSGEISKEHSPAALAGSIRSSMMGLSVMLRNGAETEDLFPILEASFQGLV